MTRIAEPFDGGPRLTEAGWQAIFDSVVSDGVVLKTGTELQLYSDGDGRQVKLRPGSAIINGHRFWTDETTTIPVPSNFWPTTATATRYVYLRLSLSEKTFYPVLSPGATGADLYYMARGENGYWDMRRGHIILRATDNTRVAPTDVIDWRLPPEGRPPVGTVQLRHARQAPGTGNDVQFSDMEWRSLAGLPQTLTAAAYPALAQAWGITAPTITLPTIGSPAGAAEAGLGYFVRVR